jgi:hypothetical protein
MGMKGIMIAIGASPIIRGGYVMTQMRDAGNDPNNKMSGGELNGILTADGKEKIPAEEFRTANEIAERYWRKSLREYISKTGRRFLEKGEQSERREEVNKGLTCRQSVKIR